MGGGTGARQKGQCFKCRKETLRCTMPNCNGFTECVQSSGGDAAKDEAKCAVCRGEVQHWEREASDDMFDYTRAEGYVKTEEENAKKEERIETRSHHLGLKVLKHQESAEGHINYVVEVRLGLDEPYHVAKRFSEFKQLVSKLGKMRYKPKEVEKEAGGQFLTKVPTDWYQMRTKLQPKDLKEREEELNGWCKQLADWATKLMNPRSPTAVAFVDLLRSVGSEEERAALGEKLQLHENFEPVRGFFLREGDNDQSAQTASTSPAAAPAYQGGGGGGGGGRRTSVSSLTSDMEEQQVAPAAPPPRHSHSASANVYQPEPEPEPELAEVDERPEEEEQEIDMDGAAVTYATTEGDSQPVVTVAALREKWKAGEVDEKTYIWMDCQDHEMFVDEGGNPTADWQPLGGFVDGFGFPPKSRAV